MKRPPVLPDLSAPSRGRRHLSEEERTLWESVARQVKPLRKKRRVGKTRGADVRTGSRNSRHLPAAHSIDRRAQAEQAGGAAAGATWSA